MVADDPILLSKFARDQSQDAFTALVNRHLNLVYSAALRQVRSPQLAEEVSQTVFLTLARNAGQLEQGTILTAWLYQVTRNAAIDVVRREANRQAREQIAYQMSALNEPSTEWKNIEPLLDEAMEELEEADRSALLLRFFENKSLREVGEALGATEDAAQKRVSRALDRLREHFSKRKITVGAAALAALLSANTVQAAPAGLAIHVAAGAAAGLATISTTTAAVSKTIAITMTASQKITVATIVAAGAIALGVYEARDASKLRGEVAALRAQTEQAAGLSNQVRELTMERDSARRQLASVAVENTAKAKDPNEALKLRGQVSQLRREKTELGATSGLSKATANPETRKLMREQQKAGMSMVYGKFAKDMKLTPEQTEKLNDLMADHVMNNVENVTVALREKMSTEQMTQLFANQEAVLQAKLQEIVGEEGMAKYHSYAKELLPEISAMQFKSLLTGEDAAKDQKAKTIARVLSEESQAALTAANLPNDYQLVPMLNFRNIASETEGERSLQLLDTIYSRASEKLTSVLSKEELAKFQDFKGKAITNNRAALGMNRALMEPIGN